MNNPVQRTTGIWVLLLWLIPCFTWAQSNRPIEEWFDSHDPDDFLNSYSGDTNFYELGFYLRNILDINEDPIQKPEAYFGNNSSNTGLNFFMYNPSVLIPQVIFNGVPQGPPFWKQPLIDWYKINPDGTSGQFGAGYIMAGDCSYIKALQNQSDTYGLLCFNPAEVYDAQFPQKFYGNNGGLYSFAKDQIGVGFDFSFDWDGFRDLNAFYLPAMGRVPLQVFKRATNSASVTSNHLSLSDILNSDQIESTLPDMHFFKGYSEYDEYLRTNYGLDTTDADQYQEMRKNYNGMGASMLSKYTILPVSAKTALTVTLDSGYYEVLLVALDTMMSQEGLLANSTRISGELGYWENGSGQKMAFSWYQLDLEGENGVQTFYEDFPFLLLFSNEIDANRFDTYNPQLPYGVTAYLGTDMQLANPLAQNPFPLVGDINVEAFSTTIFDADTCLPLECINHQQMHGTVGVVMDSSDLRMYYLATDFLVEQLLDNDGYYSTYIRPIGKGSNGEIYNLYRMDGRWDTINSAPVQDPFDPLELVYFDLSEYGPWPLINDAELTSNQRSRRSPVDYISANVKGTNFTVEELKPHINFNGFNITSVYPCSGSSCSKLATNLSDPETQVQFTSLNKAGGLLKVFVENPGDKIYAIASSQNQFSTSGTDQANYTDGDWHITKKEKLFSAKSTSGPVKDFFLFEIICHRHSYLIKMRPDGPFIVGNEVNVLGPQENDVNRLMRKQETSAKYIVCAHRGFWRDPGVPENNIPAFIAAQELADVNMIELDVKYSKDGKLILYHDDEMSRLSNLMDKLKLLEGEKERVNATLFKEINWDKPTANVRIQKTDDSGDEIFVTLPPLKYARPKDRFGNVVDISMMSLEDALIYLKSRNIMIALDKITGKITQVFETALRTDTEDIILLKGNAGSYSPPGLKKKFGIVMEQIYYTPYLFAETTYKAGDDLRNSIQTVADFTELDNWHIPGFEIQLKTTAEAAPDYKKAMNTSLRDWVRSNKHNYWIGVTSVTPSDIDRVDVKPLFDGCTPHDMALDPETQKPLVPDHISSCSNYDWRADWIFCVIYLHADYFITDRPELTADFLTKYQTH